MESSSDEHPINSLQRDSEAVDLLEEAWFYGSFLHRNRKHMTRCFSDPCPSSMNFNSGDNHEPEKNPDSESRESRESSPKMPIRDCPSSSYDGGDDKNGCFDEPDSEEKSMENIWNEAVRGNKDSDGSGRKALRPVLLRAPSLPPCIGREEIGERSVEAKSYPRMSKANRQSSLNISDLLPPRHDPKGIFNYRSRISSEDDMRRRLLNRTKSIKSRGELEYEELQGFKDLGFTFDKKDLNPSIVNILPGLQEKKDDAQEDEKQRKQPYLSEAWLTQSFAPPIPKWRPKGSDKEDVKAHIKFWARAVASNVRQEC